MVEGWKAGEDGVGERLVRTQLAGMGLAMGPPARSMRAGKARVMGSRARRVSLMSILSGVVKLIESRVPVGFEGVIWSSRTQNAVEA